jgi:hypothetical protein
MEPDHNVFDFLLGGVVGPAGGLDQGGVGVGSDLRDAPPGPERRPPGEPCSPHLLDSVIVLAHLCQWLLTLMHGIFACQITQADLMKAAQRQLHGKLQMANLADKTTPLRGLEHAVLPEAVKRDLQTMIDYAKTSEVSAGGYVL